jgi:hypothetical protein
MIWRAQSPEGTEWRTIYIDAERWFDARQYALSKLGEKVEVIATEGVAPDVTLEWHGHDSGDRPNRRIVVKEHERV